MARVPALLALLLALTALAGCTFSQGSIPGGYGQQGAVNERDHFQYGLQGTKSGQEGHTWQMTGSVAVVRWGAQGSGSLTVTISDADGKQVFKGTFSGGQSGGEQRTSPGRAGAWTIHLAFRDFNGQGGLEVVKA